MNQGLFSTRSIQQVRKANEETLKQLFLGTTENLKALARSQHKKLKKSHPKFKRSKPVRPGKKMKFMTKQFRKKKLFTSSKKVKF